MKTTFTARHFDASTHLKNYALGSIDKLEQFYDKIIACDIVLEPTQDDENPTKAEFNVKVPQVLLRASESAPTYEQAVNNAVDNLVRQLRKYKEKRFKHN
ncbi:MAG: ribosome hibernation-promoting factor, HPF/YfiA family [Balneolaceae bacterium]